MRAARDRNEAGQAPKRERDREPIPHDIDVVMRSLKNPHAAARAMVKFEAEQSLLNYTKLMWHVIEPGAPLVVNWTMEALCEQCEAISRGEILRWVGNVPPGFSKTTIFQIMWPTWEWGPRDRADLRMLAWSYAAHLTEKAADRSRDLMQSPLYRLLWGSRFSFDPKQNAKNYYATSKKGFRISTSIDGVGTGERGDRLTLDDPHSVLGGDSDADRQHVINFLSGALTTRVRNPGLRQMIVDGLKADPSTIAIIMQRVHKRDASAIAKEMGFAHFMVEMEFDGMGHPVRKVFGWVPALGFVDPRFKWLAAVDAAIENSNAMIALRSVPNESAEHAELNRYLDTCSEVWLAVCRDIARLADPIRFPREVLDRDKKAMAFKQGTDAVASQFRQWPIDTTNSMMRREFFKDKIVKLREVPTEAIMDVRGWDFASKTGKKNDRTASVRLRMTVDKSLYVMAYHAGRYTSGGVEKLIKETVERDAMMTQAFGGPNCRPSVPIDPGQAGDSQIAHFTKSLFHGLAFDATREETNKVNRFKPISAQAEFGNLYVVDSPDLEDFLSEICEMPKGEHDDYPDALSRAYDCIIRLMETDDDFFTPELGGVPEYE